MLRYERSTTSLYVTSRQRPNLCRQRKPMLKKSHKRKAISATCAFCRGKGIDPFGIMSYTSRCCVCGGKGTVLVQPPFFKCAHCCGTGAIKTLTCTACRGKGVLPIMTKPTRICPTCRGSGDDLSNRAMYCLQCRGSGVVLA